MRLRHRIASARRRRDPGLRHDDVGRLLRRMRSAQTRANQHDPHPNRGYSTPFDGGQYPGVNPGGPF